MKPSTLGNLIWDSFAYAAMAAVSLIIAFKAIDLLMDRANRKAPAPAVQTHHVVPGPGILVVTNWGTNWIYAPSVTNIAAGWTTTNAAQLSEIITNYVFPR